MCSRHSAWARRSSDGAACSTSRSSNGTRLSRRRSAHRRIRGASTPPPRRADDRRLHDPAEIGTDPRRARAFDAAHAELFNRFFQELRIDGWRAPAEPPIRATGRYLAPDLGGVWARSPYLHNGSVRTLADLLTPPASRPATLRRGSHVYDTARMGFLDDGPYVLDATAPGNGNGGHDYGTDLAPDDKRDLIEYLKTR
jgi:hypothetical protein